MIRCGRWGLILHSLVHLIYICQIELEVISSLLVACVQAGLGLALRWWEGNLMAFEETEELGRSYNIHVSHC